VKSLTEQYGAEIHVLYVIEDVAHHDGWYGAFEQKRVQELMDHASKTANKRLGQICENTWTAALFTSSTWPWATRPRRFSS